jgi:class 3 adenylate cyclase/predicted ATPase
MRKPIATANWLAEIGMPQYTSLFADNGIELDILPDLTEGDLSGMGIILGDRKRLLRAIAALRDEDAPAVAQSDAPPTATPDESLRRHLTVLFCDLVGSTPMSHRLDPEDFGEVIRRYQDICTGAIARGAGYTARFMGDGILAYFGYPQAHEDDAERATRVGLELVFKIATLRTTDGEPLHARVGIATGLVVMDGVSIVNKMTGERQVLGETPNLAARLQGLAEPDTVLISDGTHQLLGEIFTCEDRGLHQVKGLTNPVRVWRALRERKTESRFDAVRSRNLTQLVGRASEFTRLMELWATTCKGSGAVALVSGEAGIGKSRLCRALLDAVKGDEHYAMRYQCSPHHMQSPFYPIINQLEHAADFERDDDDDTKLDKLGLLLSQSGVDSKADLPLFAALLSIPAEHRHPLPELSPTSLRERTIKALIRHLLALAARKPVLFVMEDLHWIDPTSLELLNRCLANAKTAPVFMVLTARMEFLPTWLDEPHVYMFRLNRLEHKDVVAMIERITNGRSMPENVYQQIINHTDGVPLFVEELTKTIIESGVLRQAENRYEWVGPMRPLVIPATLQETLMARLDRLESTREVAQVAAVIGREFYFRLLSAVAQMPRTELSAALEKLSGAGLIYGRGDPPESHYTFKHALVQGAAYETLLRAKRRQLHARIAEVVIRDFSSTAETEPELIAHHLIQGGLTESAIKYLQRAAQRAIQRSANAEAIGQLRRARDLLCAQPDTPGRRAALLDVDVDLGQAMIAGVGYAAAETREVLIRAKSYIDEATEPEKKLAILYGLWASYYVGSNLPMQREIGEEFLAEANLIGDSAAQSIGNRILGTTLVTLGDFQAARVLLERAYSLYDPVEHPRYRFQYGQDIGVAALCYLSWALWHLGEYEIALQKSKQAVERAMSLPHPHTKAYAMCHAMGMLDMFRDQPAAVENYATEIIHLCEENGFEFWVSCGQILAGWAKIYLGAREQGVEQFRSGLAAWRDRGAGIWVHYYLGREAEALLENGETDLALSKVDEALAISATSGERWSLAELLRIKANIFLCQNPPDMAAAETLLLEAMKVARLQGARFWLARIAADLAEIWRASGRQEEARDLLSNTPPPPKVATEAPSPSRSRLAVANMPQTGH